MHARALPHAPTRGMSSRLHHHGALHVQLAAVPCMHRPCRVSNSPSGDFSGYNSTSMDFLQQRQQMQHLQVMQQQRRQQQQGPQQLPGEETDLLWAGYSALEEQLQKHHQRHDALVAQIHEMQAKLHAVQQQQPATAWQAASFLLFFLFFINFVGMIANFQMGFMWPWAVATKASASGLWFRSMLGVAVPLTNTLVILIFCLQAVKAAWTCLKW